MDSFFWIKVNTPSQEKIRNVLLWGDNHVRFPSIMVGPNSSNIWKYPMDSLILQWNNSYLNNKNIQI